MFKSHVNVSLQNDVTVVTSESGFTRNSPEPCSEPPALSAGTRGVTRATGGCAGGRSLALVTRSLHRRVFGVCSGQEGEAGRAPTPAEGGPPHSGLVPALCRCARLPCPPALCPPALRPIVTVGGARPRARVRCLPSAGGQSSVWLGGFSQGHVPTAQMSQRLSQAQRVAVRPASALGRSACRVSGLSWGQVASLLPWGLGLLPLCSSCKVSGFSSVQQSS